MNANTVMGARDALRSTVFALLALPAYATAAPIEIDAIFDPVPGPVASSIWTAITPVNLEHGQEIHLNVTFSNGKYLVLEDVGSTDELFVVSLFPGDPDVAGFFTGSVLFDGVSGDFRGPNPSASVPGGPFARVPAVLVGDNGIDWTQTQFAFTGLHITGTFDLSAGSVSRVPVDTVSIDEIAPLAELRVASAGVPEPTTWATVFLGLAGIAALRFQRRVPRPNTD